MGEIKTCENCEQAVEIETLRCSICNFPINGTQEAQSIFYGKQIVQKGVVEESFDSLKKARNILYAISVILLLSALTSLRGELYIEDQIVYGFVGLIFAACAFFIKKKPKIALLIPLSLLTIFYSLTLILYGFEVFWTGILWKIIFMVGISYAFIGALKADKIMKENPYLASKYGFSKSNYDDNDVIDDVLK